MTDHIQKIPAAYLRGGTSKGVFLHSKDLPPAGPLRDDLLLRIMGSPDPSQIDGMGGTYSSTSKVVVVEATGPHSLTYWFAQVGIDTDVVDWSGNCGNLTTAVAPFAIDEGIVEVSEPHTLVTMLNANTGITIEATVEIESGRAKTTGAHAVAGVPGTGSPVTTMYMDPAGGVFGALLPTGNPTDVLSTPVGEFVVSIVDVAHPNVFVEADAIDLDGYTRDVATLAGDRKFLERIEHIRAAAAVRLGRVNRPDEARIHSSQVPRIIVVWPDADGASIATLSFSMQQVHRALPMTGALCVAAATRVHGTLVHKHAAKADGDVTIRHPKGTATVLVDGDGENIRSVGIVRTARRIMDGIIYPREK